jgi:ABC-2 type transport system ATP-binding protein
MAIAVKINNLSITLGKKIDALKNIDIELTSGKITGFIGPSGAGKTTLVRAIAGRLRVPDGTISIFNSPAGSLELRSEIAYMTQELSVYSDLSVKDNLIYFAAMTGQSRTDANKNIAEVLKLVDMSDKLNEVVDRLSGGQKQRVSLAIALMASPKLLILDEPTVGLDPLLRNTLWNLFARLAAGGTTLLITSHSMDEAGKCDDLVLLRDGEVLVHSSPQALLLETHSHSVEESFVKLVRSNA